MCVHVRRRRAHPHRACSRAAASSSTTSRRPTDDDTSIDGNIYLGRVQNVLPGHGGRVRRHRHARRTACSTAATSSFDPADVEAEQPRIEQLLKNGQIVLVQVTKNPIGAKGARLTQEVSLAGRFVVMVPGQPETYGISKRLPDDERKRLRKVLDGMRPPDAGLIVRTAAEGATAEELERDVAAAARSSGSRSRASPPGRSRPRLALPGAAARRCG